MLQCLKKLIFRRFANCEKKWMMLKGEDEHWCSERRKESEKGAKWKKCEKEVYDERNNKNEDAKQMRKRDMQGCEWEKGRVLFFKEKEG